MHNTPTQHNLHQILSLLESTAENDSALAASLYPIAEQILVVMEHYGAVDLLSLSPRQMYWYFNALVGAGEEHPAQPDLTFDSYTTSGISGPLIDHDDVDFQEGSSLMCGNAIAAVEQPIFPQAPPHGSHNLSRAFRIVELEQEIYRHGAPIDGEPIPPIQFTARGQYGISYKDLKHVDNAGQLAFSRRSSLKAKAALRFGFMQHEVKQVNIRRIDDSPITIATMARTILRALKTTMRGQPLRYHGENVPFERLVLLRVVQVTRGSLQPFFGMVVE